MLEQTHDGAWQLFVTHSTQRMSALHRLGRIGQDEVLLNCVSFLVLCVCIFAPAAFVFTRMYRVHSTYNTLLDERDSDQWLMQQCTQDQFYHNMKQHSDICDSVSARQRDNLLMKACSNVLDETLRDGVAVLTQSVSDAASWAVGRGIVATCICVLVLLFAPTLLLPIFRRHMNRMADKRLQTLHHAPYGQVSYVDSALQRHYTPWHTRDLNNF